MKYCHLFWSQTLKIWNGASVTLSGYNLYIRVPAAYAGLTKAICGNFDGNKENDYEKEDGTILPYNPSRKRRSKAFSWRQLRDFRFQQAKISQRTWAAKRDDLPEEAPELKECTDESTKFWVKEILLIVKFFMKKPTYFCFRLQK